MSYKKRIINIVLGGDKNYSKVIGITMVSVLNNLNINTYARFFLYTEGFSDDDINEIKKIKKKYPCEINFTDVKEYMKVFDFVEQKNFTNSWISKGSLHRLFMFKYLPDDVQECFYIDSDIIVDGDLSQIKLPDDKIFAAVPEGYAMQFRDQILAHWYNLPEFSNFVKDPLKYTHFCSGFYLANIKKAKELNIFEQILSLLKKYPDIPYCDQDILNAIFGQKYQELMYYLPPEYNVFADMDYSMNFDKIPFSNEVFQQAVKNPIVIHFGGVNKPWINNYCRHFFHKWWFYYLKSPWKVECILKYTDLIIKKQAIQFIHNIVSSTKIFIKKFFKQIFSVRNEYKKPFNRSKNTSP